ncbi:inactive tyrosine-protein kinase PRAG1 isoform X2 [Cololabis saira]|uniref:inactive tyrosine-protein kinase PRAG1 isoform X2 n=1 Tax=Cololabis saira TaxID=129043 RepID=UPI002AD4BBF5|nr:inactive tyrosine-protein kinase PRAG1 isoform X2 [Cololabis saira]
MSSKSTLTAMQPSAPFTIITGRAFSETTPPPVPKKKLNRSISFPVTEMSSPSPATSPFPRETHFENPLYMMTGIPDTFFQEEAEDIRSPRGSPVPLPSLSQLSFDTPDDHLPSIFSNIEDRQVVSQEIQHRLLLLLRSMARSVEVRSLRQGEATGRGFTSYQPQDFLLCERSKPKQIGDNIYYSIYSPEFPKRVLGLKVHKQTGDSSSAHAAHLPSHVNVQDVIAHFQPSNDLQKCSTTLQYSTNSYCSPKPHCSNSEPAAGGSTEAATVESLLQRGCSASVERDLPHATLDDFVQEGSSLPRTEGSHYDRQVCVLLLQVLVGAQHLHSSDAAAALKSREILLVWPWWERDGPENEMKVDVSQGLGGSKERGQTESKGEIQALWKRHGSPRVVLVPQRQSQPITSIKSQIGALIQFCLQCGEKTPLGSLFKSSYRRGLLLMSSLLQGDNPPQMSSMVAVLQVLLWGPRGPLFDPQGPSGVTVCHWLTIKRALLLMKLAERGLNLDRSALDWEDCLCLQYLAFTDAQTIMRAVGLLEDTLSSN